MSQSSQISELRFPSDADFTGRIRCTQNAMARYGVEIFSAALFDAESFPNDVGELINPAHQAQEAANFRTEPGSETGDIRIATVAGIHEGQSERPFLNRLGSGFGYRDQASA